MGRALVIVGFLIFILGIIFAAGYIERFGILGSLPDMYVVIKEGKKYCPPGNEVVYRQPCEEDSRLSSEQCDALNEYLSTNEPGCKEWVIEPPITIELRNILAIGIIIFSLGIFLVTGKKNHHKLFNSRNKPNEKDQPTTLDQVIYSVYGNPPPEKSAKLDEAIELAYEDLLTGLIDKRKVAKTASSLDSSPIPYSTHDLALSVALHYFKKPELIPKLKDAQLKARATALQWTAEKIAAPMLVKSFENVLYKLYK